VKDAEARKRARLNLGANTVVEAGAGTGKTTLLSDRFLFTLLAGGGKGEGVELTRIVALTFTEKAAGEIKDRLFTRLLDTLAHLEGRELPPARRKVAELWLKDAKTAFNADEKRVRAMAEAALREMDRANIGTIHHFAAQLLRRYPLEAGVDPSFEVDEGGTFDELFEAEWARWLDRELGEHPSRKALWLEVLAHASLEELAALARVLSSEGMRQAGLSTTPAMRESLRKLAHDFKHLDDPKLKRPKPRGAIRENLPPIAAFLEDFAHRLEKDEKLPDLPVYRAFKHGKWPSNWEDPEAEKVYAEGWALAENASPEAELLVKKGLELVLPFADEFRKGYLRRGYIGYDGLLVKARDLVRDHREVREALKERFAALLIDEFQDTDPLQGELLLFLGEEPKHHAKDWGHIHFGPGRLFVVGDPKQSIYRFRGADIRAYEGFTAALINQGAERCDLQTNFRSHKGIIAPVNAVFSRVLVAEPGLQPPYKEIYERPAGDEPRAPGLELALVLPEEGKDEAKTEPASWAQARWCADWILRNCIIGKNEGKFHLRDVALLLRTTRPMGAYLDAFKNAGIPFVVEADGYFFGTQEVVDFVNLLRVLDDPEDRVALAGLLRSPLAAIDDDELLALSRARELRYDKDPVKAEIPNQTKRRLASFFKVLRELRERAGREPLGDFVGLVLERSFLLEALSAVYHREQTLANLLKFRRMAAEASEDSGLTLREFIGAVARSMRDAAREGESPLADDGLDAVRVLTIHRAKGLEFPVVLLPELSRNPPSGGGDESECQSDWYEGTVGLALGRRTDLAWHRIDASRREREEREALRLLYVAMTRAKEHLVLMGVAQAKQTRSFAGILREAGFWPAKGEQPLVLGVDGVKLEPQYLTAAYKSTEEPALPEGKKRQPDGKALAKAWSLRAEECGALSAKKLFITPTDALKELPKRPASEERELSAVRAQAALVGDICHKFLEGWDYKGGGKLEPSLAEAVRLILARHPAADPKALADECRPLLEKFLASAFAKELAKVEILARELPFVAAHEGSVLRGSIDLLYRKDGKLRVADYKTGTADKAQAADVHRSASAAGSRGALAAHAERYKPQARAYASAVHQALGELPSVELVFLRSGQVVELPFH
jgi:ATP-dependent helicase/nuclease subunit A